jgi:hypothetical protein
MFALRHTDQLFNETVNSGSCVDPWAGSGLASPSSATEAGVRDRLCREMLARSNDRQLAAFEFWIPRTYERADLVVIGAEIESFEIKTDRDTLRRLPRQVIAYGRIFDRCTAVIAERHADAALQMLPEWWGLSIFQSDPAFAFTRLRKARTNSDVDAELLVRLLWRQEAYAALVSLGLEVDARASRHSLWRALLEATSLAQLSRLVRRTLLDRDPFAARIGTRRFIAPQPTLEAAR